MKFIEPKPTLPCKVNWSVSEQTKAIVKHYTEYTGYTESEVVDQFLKNLLDDKQFIEWIKSKRRNKRAISQLFPDEVETEETLIG